MLAEPTAEILERIADVAWGLSRQYDDAGLRIFDVHRHNACNFTYVGEIDHEGQTYAFVIDSGDWAGTVVREWCAPEHAKGYTPEYVEPPTFVPEDDTLFQRSPAKFMVYGYWRTEYWFKEMERAYNYDRHFAPGHQTETTYRNMARAKGLKVGYMSHFSPDELKAIQDARLKCSN